jgi:tetrahydromethanopterin S-methyltransferase subunit G
MANEDMILEILKRIQGELGEVRRRVDSMDTRMAAFEEHMSGVIISIGGMQADLRQINARVDRIDRRLDLVNA